MQATRRAHVLFVVKASVLRLLRTWRDLRDGQLRRWPVSVDSLAAPLVAESVSALQAGEGEAEHALVLGKIENLRVALRTIDGLAIPAGGLFSFWKQIGRPLARRGYVAGRELREGCIIPSIGGGLCQLSNGLYQAALAAGVDIVERHAHTQRVPGSAAELGQDATVFWNYVDLRLRCDMPFRIHARLDEDSLRIAISREGAPHVARVAMPFAVAGQTPLSTVARSAPQSSQRSVAAPLQQAPQRSVAGVAAQASPRACAECGQDACFRRAASAPLKPAPLGRRTVVMVDAVWPEFDTYINAAPRGSDRLFVPLDGQTSGRARYAWASHAFAEVRTFPLLAMWRALASRRLAGEGAARQRSALLFRQRLARAYAQALRYDDEHIVITQELLPHVWQLGALQGRRFDVLMTGLPMDELQAQLDTAFARHPYSTTLADFRAPPPLLALERAALARAHRIVTPHHNVAALFPNVTVLPWSMPARPPRAHGARIVFPASTLARKGAYEMRAAARELGLRLTLMGPVLEAPGFWDGLDVEQGAAAAGDSWLDDAAVVVLPAWVENRPQRLLQALACGVPVIATPACGLPPQPGLTLVGAGDTAALVAVLRSFAG